MKNYHQSVDKEKAERKVSNARSRANNTELKPQSGKIIKVKPVLASVTDLASNRDSFRTSLSPSYVCSSKWTSKRNSEVATTEQS